MPNWVVGKVLWAAPNRNANNVLLFAHGPNAARKLQFADDCSRGNIVHVITHSIPQTNSTKITFQHSQQLYIFNLPSKIYRNVNNLTVFTGLHNLHCLHYLCNIFSTFSASKISLSLGIPSQMHHIYSKSTYHILHTELSLPISHIGKLYL